MTRPARWDAFGDDWTVRVVPRDEPITALDTMYPLATKTGIGLLGEVLTAHAVWRNLTRPQRELLLSIVAGVPVKPRADVLARMVARGLVAADLTATDAGRAVIEWRLP